MFIFNRSDGEVHLHLSWSTRPHRRWNHGGVDPLCQRAAESEAQQRFAEGLPGGLGVCAAGDGHRPGRDCVPSLLLLRHHGLRRGRHAHNTLGPAAEPRRDTRRCGRGGEENTEGETSWAGWGRFPHHHPLKKAHIQSTEHGQSATCLLIDCIQKWLILLLMYECLCWSAPSKHGGMYVVREPQTPSGSWTICCLKTCQKDQKWNKGIPVKVA